MPDERIDIPLAHPAFAGHFPGRPLVPGSLLLALILDASDTPVTQVSSVKFHRPVLPGDGLTLTFTPVGEGPAVRFRCARGGDTVCAGTLLRDAAAG